MTPPPSPRIGNLLTFLTLLTLGGARPSWSAETPRVFLIGIDAASWRFIDPLLAEGKLTNLRGLMDRGSQAVLRSDDTMTSAVVWTTIATGKHHRKHGIEGWDFTTGTPPSTSRKTSALWNILSARGKRVFLDCYIVTWPAEDVNGVVVTKEWLSAPQSDPVEGALHPPAAFDPYDEKALRSFFLDNQPMRIDSRFRRDPNTAEAWQDHFVDYLSGNMHIDRAETQIAELFFAREKFDFFAIHLWGLDWVCHNAYRYDRTVSAGAASPFADVIPRYYEFLDELVGRLLLHADQDTTVIVLSDHGVRPRLDGPPLARYGKAWLTSGEHDEDGVLILSGKNIAARGKRGTASVNDITPTILYLMGLPVGKDMDGEVLRKFCRGGFVDRHPPAYVATHDVSPRPAKAPAAYPKDREELEKLKSLGYLK